MRVAHLAIAAVAFATCASHPLAFATTAPAIDASTTNGSLPASAATGATGKANGGGKGLLAPPPTTPCLEPARNGYLRARLRGALDLDLAWASPDMNCQGGARPDGRGLRVMLAGPPRADGRRMRFVFGIQDVPEGASARARPTNLTILFEGEQRVFATRGDDKCTTDELVQQRLGTPGDPRRRWRVVARGFCVAPASTLAGDARLLLTSFDFASEVSYDDDTAPPR